MKHGAALGVYVNSLGEITARPVKRIHMTAFECINCGDSGRLFTGAACHCRHGGLYRQRLATMRDAIAAVEDARKALPDDDPDTRYADEAIAGLRRFMRSFAGGEGE